MTGNGLTEVMVDRGRWKELRFKNGPVRVPLEQERSPVKMRKVDMRGATIDNTVYMAG